MRRSSCSAARSRCARRAAASVLLASAVAACGIDVLGTRPLGPDDGGLDPGATDARADGTGTGDARPGLDARADGSAPTYSDIVLADGPIHYWRFEDPTTSPTVADIGKPGGLPGTIIGNVKLGEASASSRLGKSARFDGNEVVGSRVAIDVFHPGAVITVEAWAKLEVVNKGFHAIFARWDGSYELDVQQASKRANFVAHDSTLPLLLVASAQEHTRDEWHHIVGVFSFASLTIYLDGVPGSAVATSGPLRNAGWTPDKVLIGATRAGSGTTGSGTFNWTGWIDEVAVYAKALVAADVMRHFEAGTDAHDQ